MLNIRNMNTTEFFQWCFITTVCFNKVYRSVILHVTKTRWKIMLDFLSKWKKKLLQVSGIFVSFKTNER